MLRAHATYWFDLVTTHQDFARVMQGLAQSGAAQLEVKPLEGAAPVLPKLGPFFETYKEMARRYGAVWPEAKPEIESTLEDPRAVLDDTIETLARWAKAADPLIARLQALTTARADLRMMEMLVENSGSGFPLPQVGQSDRLTHAIYFVYDSDPFEPTTKGVVSASIPTPTGVFLIAIAEPEVMARLVIEMKQRKAVTVPVPDFLGPEPALHMQQVCDQLAENRIAMGNVQAELDALAETFQLAQVLSRVSVLEWLYDNREEVRATARTTRITGWTNSENGTDIRAYLDKAGVNYVLSVAPLADRDDAPMVLRNPAWLRPFEFFPRMMGVPARGDADPSVVTALIATIMFGYMFGDVGQGAVLVVVGLLMKKQLPLLALLIPGGISAMLFGLLFGSVFSLDGVLPPLWLHPLDAPITVLLVAVLMGVAFLFVGIALDLLQALWHNQGLGWARANGGIVLTYISLLLVYFQPLALWGLPVGVLWSILGARESNGRFTAMAVATALGEYIETLMRLMVSSVSFSRVGAFALAHAGLSTAIVGIADSVGGVGFWVVLLLGNVLIIALEGLVTGIQTTRLVLFEFFTRFFHAGGRDFKPLGLPQPRSTQQKEMPHET